MIECQELFRTSNVFLIFSHLPMIIQIQTLVHMYLTFALFLNKIMKINSKNLIVSRIALHSFSLDLIISPSSFLYYPCFQSLDKLLIVCYFLQKFSSYRKNEKKYLAILDNEMNS